MIRVDLPPLLIGIFLFVLGSIIGSFLNVCIYRIPQKDSLWESLKRLWEQPSHCRRCKSNIRWYYNIPIFGWLMLGGRCRDCKAWISPRYPLIELLNGLLFVVVYWYEIGFGFSVPLTDGSLFSEIGPQVVPGLGPFSPTVFALVRYACHMVMIDALLVASFIDIDLRIIPDGSTLPAMAFAMLAGATIGRVHIVPVWFERPFLFNVGPMTVPDWIHRHPHLHGLAASLAGFAVGWSMIWVVRWIGQWALKQEAMGFGDVILMGMIGSFLGWQPMLIVFFLAPICALTVVILLLAVRFDRYIPYGPYLSLGALFTILFWPKMWPMAEGIVGSGWLIIPLAFFAALLLTLCLLLARGLRVVTGRRGPAEPIGVWGPADQTHHYSGEHVDDQQGRWRIRQNWPGTLSGRGSIYSENWRHGSR